MDLKIGIIGLKPGWKIILDQQGLNYEAVELNKKLSPNQYSVLIVDDHKTTKNNILHYLEMGGSILFSSKAYAQVFDKKIRSVRKKYLLSDQESMFSSIGLIDISNRIAIPKKANIKLIDSGLQVYSGKYKKGSFFVIPIDINKEILNMNACRRKFNADRMELPSEIVAQVSKGKIRKLLVYILQKLHYERNLPFIHKITIPDYQGLFIFRIDTDFCSKDEADAIYRLCEKHNIKATWFLDTQDKSKLEEYFSKLKGQELGLHCFKHKVFDNYNDNDKNIKRGIYNLKESNISQKGFAAPFGDWNKYLDCSLQKNNFSYSSEFVPSYDDLPFFPYSNSKFSKVLQIPIHPISPGRLRRSHFSDTEKIKYYKDIIKKRITEKDPIIIYHHPHHKMLKVIDAIFSHINSLGIPNLTMSEYASWWKKRVKTKTDISYNNGYITFRNLDRKINFLIYKDNMISCLQPKAKLLFSNIEFTKNNLLKREKNIASMRKYHWRDLLYNYESWRSRKNR